MCQPDPPYLVLSWSTNCFLNWDKETQQTPVFKDKLCGLSGWGIAGPTGFSCSMVKPSKPGLLWEEALLSAQSRSAAMVVVAEFAVEQVTSAAKLQPSMVYQCCSTCARMSCNMAVGSMETCPLASLRPWCCGSTSWRAARQAILHDDHFACELAIGFILALVTFEWCVPVQDAQGLPAATAAGKREGRKKSIVRGQAMVSVLQEVMSASMMLQKMLAALVLSKWWSGQQWLMKQPLGAHKLS